MGRRPARSAHRGAGADPRWDATSTVDDHVFHREGWPASSLHREAPAGMRAWAMGMVKELVAQYGAQQVSRRVCFLQIHAWASENFDPRSIDVLPSVKANLAMAKAAKERGALLVVKNNDAHWERLLSLPPGTLPHGNGTRKIHLSRNNMRLAPGLWERVLAAMQ